MKSISNCFVAIQGWMVESLGLKGNELMTYALIYGFSQDGKSEFTGSVSYICQWLSCSRTTAHQALKNLLDKKLIKKTEIYKNSVKYCTYRTLPVQKLNTPCSEIEQTQYRN